MWRQSSPEILGLRRAIRQRIEQLLLGSYYYNEFQGRERLSGLLGCSKRSNSWNKIVPPRIVLPDAAWTENR
jgi:hypothetical protein